MLFHLKKCLKWPLLSLNTKHHQYLCFCRFLQCLFLQIFWNFSTNLFLVLLLLYGNHRTYDFQIASWNLVIGSQSRGIWRQDNRICSPCSTVWELLDHVMKYSICIMRRSTNLQYYRVFLRVLNLWTQIEAKHTIVTLSRNLFSSEELWSNYFIHVRAVTNYIWDREMVLCFFM